MGAKVKACEKAGRTRMRSPGRPPVGRMDHRRWFWQAIARRDTSLEAAAFAGVSGPVGVRWFREGGGMPTVSLHAPSARYLCFAEREDIALLRAEGKGVREIARDRALAVDDLAGTAPQCSDAQRAHGLPGVGGAVACRAARQAPEARQARGQRQTA